MRYGEPAGAARAERDAAYADAMRDVARRFPADVDAQVLFADAMLNLRPWNQWTRDGRPQPGTLELVARPRRRRLAAPAEARRRVPLLHPRGRSVRDARACAAVRGAAAAADARRRPCRPHAGARLSARRPVRSRRRARTSRRSKPTTAISRPRGRRPGSIRCSTRRTTCTSSGRPTCCRASARRR